MVTLLNCIERIPSVLENILAQCESSFAPLFEYLGEDLTRIDEIVFIGSGTSSTAAVTSRPFVEKVSGLRTKTVLPNEYAEDGCVLNPNALHVFNSQTGTSKVVCAVLEKLNGLGLLSVSLTGDETSPIAEISPCHVPMNCGPEEYLMRTIGYTASVLDHMLLGLMLGRKRGFITEEQYEQYMRDAAAAPEDHRKVTADVKNWYRSVERGMMRSQAIIFTGAGTLYGVALEGAVKFWEMPQMISIGYELEEGLHGPNYGYSWPHCVIVFDDGLKESSKASALARYMKDEFRNGILIGPYPVDDKDLKIDASCGDFRCLAYSAVPQVLAYMLAEDGGRDVTKPADHTVMYSYFNTHSKW